MTIFADSGSKVSITTNGYGTGNSFYISDNINPIQIHTGNTDNVIWSDSNYTFNDTYLHVYETLDIIADEEIYTLRIIDNDIYLNVKETGDLILSGQTEVLEYLKTRVTQTQFLFVQRFIFEKLI